MRAAILVVLLAGCLSAPQPIEPVQEAHALALSSLAPVSAAREALQFEDACPGRCEASFTLAEIPQGGWLQVRLSWDGEATPGFSMELNTRELFWNGERGFDDSRIQAWDAVPGNYTLTITGTGVVAGTIAIHDHATSAGERLPNLVTMVPRIAGIQDCRAEEQYEQGATRCLRIGNAVGNTGNGPLEVHLGYADAALSPTGLGTFYQRIYEADGVRDVVAGPAELHPVHGHFHYDGLAHFALHPYDLDSGLRGPQIALSDKQGFCFLDWGRMEEPDAPPETEDAQHAEQDCLVPGPPQAWSMGISAGWYDYYWAALADQYIDVAGVPDGTYELVTIADGANTLLETDESDNAASVIIRIVGDAVDVLDERGHYVIPADA